MRELLFIFVLSGFVAAISIIGYIGSYLLDKWRSEA